jgi:DNA-binding GntR family transcriptional regulator
MSSSLGQSVGRVRSQKPKSDAYAEVRRHILGGDVRPRQRLSHRSLAKDLGLSRSPVREALLQLEAEGLIEHRPQSGVYLREISAAELREVYDMRALIEPYAAARAAKLASPEHLELLRQTCEEFTQIAKRPQLDRWLTAAENRHRLSMLDRTFHTTILSAAGNRCAMRFFETAQILSLVVSWNFMRTDKSVLAPRVAPTARQHEAIYRAIVKRDARAAAARMKAHITGRGKQVMAAFEE